MAATLAMLLEANGVSKSHLLLFVSVHCSLPDRLTDALYTPPTHAALSHLTSDPSLTGLVKKWTDTPSAMFISQGSHTGACYRLIAEFYYLCLMLFRFLKDSCPNRLLKAKGPPHTRCCCKKPLVSTCEEK